MFKGKLQKSFCFLNSGRAASCFKNAVSYKLFLIKVKCICNGCFFSQWSQFPNCLRRTTVREQTKEVKIREEDVFCMYTYIHYISSNKMMIQWCKWWYSLLCRISLEFCRRWVVKLNTLRLSNSFTCQIVFSIEILALSTLDVFLHFWLTSAYLLRIQARPI